MPERLIAVPFPSVVIVAGIFVLLLVIVRFLSTTFNWAPKLAPLSKIRLPLLSIRLTSDGVAVALLITAPLWMVTLLAALIPDQAVISEPLSRTNALTDVTTAPSPVIVKLLLTRTTPLLLLVL